MFHSNNFFTFLNNEDQLQETSSAFLIIHELIKKNHKITQRNPQL
jgi:hypothetical protein